MASRSENPKSFDDFRMAALTVGVEPQRLRLKPPVAGTTESDTRQGREPNAPHHGFAIMTSVALTTAVTRSPLVSSSSSALRRVITDSIRCSPTRRTTWQRIASCVISSMVPVRRFRALNPIHTLPTSEDELHRELDDARIQRRRNRPEVRGPEHGVRGAKVWRVQQIEDLSPNLDRPTCTQGDAPHEREIHVAIRGAANGVSRRRASRELRRDGKGRRVEPLTGR